jgi:hypothetical protein
MISGSADIVETVRSKQLVVENNADLPAQTDGNIITAEFPRFWPPT